MSWEFSIVMSKFVERCTRVYVMSVSGNYTVGEIRQVAKEMKDLLSHSDELE